MDLQYKSIKLKASVSDGESGNSFLLYDENLKKHTEFYYLG